MNLIAFIEAPLVSFFLARLGWLKPSFFRNRWRHALLACTVLSAVLTPSDAAVSLFGVLIFRSRQRPGAGGAKGAPRPIRSRGGRWLAVGSDRGLRLWDATTWQLVSSATNAPFDSWPSRWNGAAAFDPATLSTPIVDGLLNGGRMDALADGIRLRRATNEIGRAHV